MTNVLDPTIDLDLSRLEQRALVDAIVPEGATEPFGLYVLRGDQPAADLGRQLERAVFLETFGDTPELLAAEYDAYEASSVFFVVVDHRRRRAAGVMRVILPSPVGLKSLNDMARGWARSADDAIEATEGAPRTGAVWDVATLAVDPEYRGNAAAGLVSLSLYQALFMTGVRWGNEFLVAVLDVAVLRMLQWQLANLFRSFEGVAAAPYLGSKASRPVWCDISEWRERLQAARPELYELFFEGTGHEPAVASPDWEAAAASMREVSDPARYGAVIGESAAATRRSTAGISAAGTGLQ